MPDVTQRAPLMLYNKALLLLFNTGFFWPTTEISGRLARPTYVPDVAHQYTVETEVGAHWSSLYVPQVLNNKLLVSHVDVEAGVYCTFRSSTLVFTRVGETTPQDLRYLILYVSAGTLQNHLIGYVDFNEDLPFGGEDIIFSPDTVYGWFHIFRPATPCGDICLA